MTDERKEKEYLNNLIHKVDFAIQNINERIQSQSNIIQYLNNHMQEFEIEMDHLEKNGMCEAISNTVMLGDHSITKKKQLFQLKNAPCFGRIYFIKKI